MIRRLEPRDIPRLRELHAATGFEWEFPENLLSARVWTDEKDVPLMLVGAKVIAEAVVISSTAGTPGMRFQALQQMMREVEADVAKEGIEGACAWIPNVIWRSFSRRLKSFGWKESGYRTMGKKTCQKV